MCAGARREPLPLLLILRISRGGGFGEIQPMVLWARHRLVQREDSDIIPRVVMENALAGSVQIVDLDFGNITHHSLAGKEFLSPGDHLYFPVLYIRLRDVNYAVRGGQHAVRIY